MRRRTTHFEQVPLEVVKKIATEEPKQEELTEQKRVIKNSDSKKASQKESWLEPRLRMMNPAFDIFQVERTGVVWLAPATSVEEARAYICGSGSKLDVEYFVVDQRTGEKTAIKLDSIRSSAQSA